MQPQPSREWSYAFGKIRVTDVALVVDAPGRHASIARAEIVGVERSGFLGATTLTIAHRGGKLKLDYVKAKAAREIALALGF